LRDQRLCGKENLPYNKAVIIRKAEDKLSRRGSLKSTSEAQESFQEEEASPSGRGEHRRLKKEYESG